MVVYTCRLSVEEGVVVGQAPPAGVNSLSNVSEVNHVSATRKMSKL